MRNYDPKAFLMNYYENFIPEMRYDTARTVEEWQKPAREKLTELLGLNLMVKCDYDFLIEETKECDDYVQHRFSFQSEPGYYVVCYIQLPHGIEKIAPMICIQGHSRGQHLSRGELKYPSDEDALKRKVGEFCKFARENGYAPVTLEQRYMGENGGNDDGIPACVVPRDGRMNALPTLLFGRTAIGERVWNVIHLINVIAENFPQLDMENLACVGHSGGGTATIYAAALDERIKTVISCGAVCAFRDSIINIHHCGCNYVPSVARYFDMGEICGLVAPRKLIVVSGKDDDIFPKDGVDKVYAVAKDTYKAAGAENNITLVYGDGGHAFYEEDATEALNRLKNL